MSALAQGADDIGGVLSRISHVAIGTQNGPSQVSAGRSTNRLNYKIGLVARGSQLVANYA